MDTSKENKYIKILQKIGKEETGKNIVIRQAQGSSDARHYSRVNCPGIEFGPIGGDIGGDNEWVSITSLIQYHQILKNYLLAL
jgi:acetylornithine deacetylase/succinyl-diaminopimelate desuccinylase-like protein